MTIQTKYLLYGALAAQMAIPAIAQDASVGTIEKKEEAEKIRVTGSRIKKIDIEGSTPITVIDRAAIDASGVVSVGDLFRKSARFCKNR